MLYCSFYNVGWPCALEFLHVTHAGPITTMHIHKTSFERQTNTTIGMYTLLHLDDVA